MGSMHNSPVLSLVLTSSIRSQTRTLMCELTNVLWSCYTELKSSNLLVRTEMALLSGASRTRPCPPKPRPARSCTSSSSSCAAPGHLLTLRGQAGKIGVRPPSFKDTVPNCSQHSGPHMGCTLVSRRRQRVPQRTTAAVRLAQDTTPQSTFAGSEVCVWDGPILVKTM
jgi:hypothetical protein